MSVEDDFQHPHPTRHDILDLPELGSDCYISIARDRDAPPLSLESERAFRNLAAAVLASQQRERASVKGSPGRLVTEECDPG